MKWEVAVLAGGWLQGPARGAQVGRGLQELGNILETSA